MNELATTWTPAQIELIRNTYAKGASQQEFEIFLYKCKHLEMDPLKNQIYFVKYGTNPGTVIIGLDGFRARAAKTGLHSGTVRGVKTDESGKVTHGWCKIYRKDWTEPAYEESPMSEYNTGRGMWAKMPETMIKKIAEIAALRMAFPDQLSGLETTEEITSPESEIEELKNVEDRKRSEAHAVKVLEEFKPYDKKVAEEIAKNPPSKGVTIHSGKMPTKEVLNHATGEVLKAPVMLPSPQNHTILNWKIPFGKFTGKTLQEVGLKEAKRYQQFLLTEAEKTGKMLDGHALTFSMNVDEMERMEKKNG